MDTYHFRKQIHKLPGKVIHAIPLPEPDVTEGHGARGRIGEICRENGYKQVLLVTDRTLHALGFEQPVVASLEAAGVGCTVFDDIHSEPCIATTRSRPYGNWRSKAAPTASSPSAAAR